MTDTEKILLAAVVLCSIVAFLFGWDISETRERRAHKATKAVLTNIRMSKFELTNWVQTNWPAEYEAWRDGHRQGYQQGVMDAPKLGEEP